MKVAILHPWLLMRGGGERVLDVLVDLFPDADVFVLFLEPSQLSPTLRKRRVVPSKLNGLPLARRFHRHLFPLYPWAVESLDLRDYDLVISSCGPAMMGAAVRQDAVHVCYCHTPQRAWWDLYAEHQSQLGLVSRAMYVAMAASVRMFEHLGIQRVDSVVANSAFIKRRISKYFGRSSEVIYPPVDVSKGYLDREPEDYYLYVGRLERQKRVDLVILACNQLGRQLKISGAGKEERYLRSIAGPTITFLGHVPDEQVGGLFGKCRAFIFAAVEDFGIAPVEAQSYGRPVIAYGSGGSLETVRVNDEMGRPDTGVLFACQTVDSLVEAITCFELTEGSFSAKEIQAHANQFDTAVFKDKFLQHVDAAIQERALQ